MLQTFVCNFLTLSPEKEEGYLVPDSMVSLPQSATKAVNRDNPEYMASNGDNKLVRAFSRQESKV